MEQSRPIPEPDLLCDEIRDEEKSLLSMILFVRRPKALDRATVSVRN
jgi:hypothetical protein